MNVVSEGLIRDIADIEQSSCRSEDGSPVYLKDVARR